MKLPLILPLCALFPTLLAMLLEKRADYAVKSSHFVPPGWEQIGQPSDDHTINLRIGLKQSSFHELERHLYEVSDPAHSRYGLHLSQEEVHSLVAPSQDALTSVQGWLESHGIFADQISYSASSDWASLLLPVRKVEDLLATEYHTYRNGKGEEIVRAIEYSLPKHLHGHVDTVQPTNHFATASAMARVQLPESSIISRDANKPSKSPPTYPDLTTICNADNGISSLCVRTLYKTVDYMPKVPHKNSAGMTAYLNDTPSDADFAQYMTVMRPGSEPGYGFSREVIANAFNDQTMPGAESNIDTQAMGGIIYPTPLKAYVVGGSPPYKPDNLTVENTNEPYLTWLDYVLKQKNLPSVISTSYGDLEETVPRDYAIRVCNEFAQLGARGVTVLFASGDFGIGTNDTCVSNDGTNRRKFQPEFPSSCPYVTSVGATFQTNPEVVVQSTFRDGSPYVSGSGFSEYFPRPSYQNAAVSSYLSRIGNIHKGIYNRAGRAYPDIAAQGDKFAIILEGKPDAYRGTSISSPVAAGVLTLVNDALIAAGKRPLGFLNPLLYSTKGCGFTDITKGRSTGCETDGFPAAKGWDVASGWGTPDFKAIRQHLGV